MRTKFEMKPLRLVFVLGALLASSAIGVPSVFASVDALHLDFQGAATIARTTSEGSTPSGTAANFGLGRDTDALFGSNLRGPKSGGSQWPDDANGVVRSGFPVAGEVLAQTGGPVTLPLQAEQ